MRSGSKTVSGHAGIQHQHRLSRPRQLHGGGWELARPLSAISLLDVYEAIGSPPLFNIGPGAESADCLVEKAVDARLGLAMEEAERKLLKQFSEIAVEDLAQDFEQRFAALQVEAGEANANAAFRHVRADE